MRRRRRNWTGHKDGDGHCKFFSEFSHSHLLQIIGQIANMTTQQSSKASRLEYQIKIFVKFLTILAFIIGLVAFVVGGINTRFEKVVPLLVTSFTVCAVAMIPEVERWDLPLMFLVLGHAGHGNFDFDVGCSSLGKQKRLFEASRHCWSVGVGEHHVRFFGK